MDKPIVAQKQFTVVPLVPGESYWWCRCGRSAEQPFCDGAHNALTGIQPLEFTVDVAKNYALCQCKQTRTPPFCDGSHKTLDKKGGV